VLLFWYRDDTNLQLVKEGLHRYMVRHGHPVIQAAQGPQGVACHIISELLHVYVCGGFWAAGCCACLQLYCTESPSHLPMHLLARLLWCVRWILCQPLLLLLLLLLLVVSLLLLTVTAPGQWPCSV